MKKICAALLSLIVLASARAGETATTLSTMAAPPHLEFASESGYLLGIFSNPHSYEVNANFLTARVLCGDFTHHEGFFRGYNQVYFSLEGQPIIRGIENRYFGINLGLRYNFGRAGARWTPYVSGGLGLGFIDSNADGFGSQGQDFIFNILSAVGVSYRVSERASLQAGLLYEHFSNAGLSNPNPSLNLLGPQVGFTLSF